MTFQTDGTFPCADQSQGWKCDTCRGKQTFPPEASVSVYPQHRVCDAAHIQALLFLDFGWIHFRPDSGSLELKSNFIAQIYQECDAIQRFLLSEPSGGGAAGGILQTGWRKWEN